MSTHLFTSESVSEGHPDKVADQISDSVLDAIFEQDNKARVACETMINTGMVVIAGEITTSAWIDMQEVVRATIKEIGYNSSDMGFDYASCAVITSIDKQSADIAAGVDESSDHEQGAGDQGLMFGYASNETDVLMPAPITYAHRLVKRQAELRKNGTLPWLRPDAKSQVTFKYVDGEPVGINAVVLSTQHDPEIEYKNLREAVMDEIIKPVLPAEWLDQCSQDDIHINPTGKFVIGGPHGDTGLTGRKIIVDTYGGHGAHGGGAFSGKDSSKVDRSAAYAARHIAKNLVAAGVADKILIQVAYAIGVSEPVGFYLNTYNSAHVTDEKGNKLTDGEIAKKVSDIYDMTPYEIVKRFGLKYPIFRKTASYGHFGREPFEEEVELKYDNNGSITKKIVEFFAWEKLDEVENIKAAFKL